jgi:hypothetical protein
LSGSILTWFVAVGILSDLSKNVSALALQAGSYFFGQYFMVWRKQAAA